jgi:hypothetical protein
MSHSPDRFSFAVVVVNLYLIVVGLCLMISGQIPADGIKKTLRYLVRRRYRGRISAFRADVGNCWIADLPQILPSDADSCSRIQLFENGVPLGPPHALHDDIRKLGEGRFSHWGSQIYFSTSDNSAPATNGRLYTVKEQ